MAENSNPALTTKVVNLIDSNGLQAVLTTIVRKYDLSIILYCFIKAIESRSIFYKEKGLHQAGTFSQVKEDLEKVAKDYENAKRPITTEE